MTPPNSISFDEVLSLLRGPLMQGFEAQYVATRGYTLYEDWGDSQHLTKELAFARVTRANLEEILVSRSACLGRYLDQMFSLPRPTEEEPDEPPVPMTQEGPDVTLGRGFSLPAACEIWLLSERPQAELVDWLKRCGIPRHEKHAQDLRRIYSACTDFREPQ